MNTNDGSTAVTMLSQDLGFVFINTKSGEPLVALSSAVSHCVHEHKGQRLKAQVPVSAAVWALVFMNTKAPTLRCRGLAGEHQGSALAQAAPGDLELDAEAPPHLGEDERPCGQRMRPLQ